MLRRRVAARRLWAMKSCVACVGAGAFGGREPIQCSASSSSGERRRRPDDAEPPASAQRRALSPNSVCFLIQPMSDCSASLEPRRAFREPRRIVEEDEVEPRQSLGHRLVVDPAEDDRREALVERSGVRDFLLADR